ncbi:unnamed protein product, partial [Meganyctiphanes norvegica]
ADVREDIFKKINSNIKHRTRWPTVWEFLVRLILNPATNPSLVCWEVKQQHKFRLNKPEDVARVWKSKGLATVKESKDYANFARALRYWYSHGGLELVKGRQLVYQLGPLGKAYLAELQEDTSASFDSS